MNRRALLQATAVAAIPAAAVAVPLPHPDAELLALCRQLQAQQAEWQRLWSFTDDGPDDKPENAAFIHHVREVWPGTYREQSLGPDLPKRLLTLRATTLEGLRAKAAVVRAIDEAGGYLLCDRDDMYELTRSVLDDAAGDAFVPMGEDHPSFTNLQPAGHE